MALSSTLSKLRQIVLPERGGRDLARKLIDGSRFVAVDVGAANGLLPHWHSLDGVAMIYQIEPREDACRDLEDANARSATPELYRVVRAGVSGTDGMRTLYVSNAPTGTSLLPPNPAAVPDCADYVDPAYLFPITEQQIATRTLASVMAGERERWVDLIKLDIQGAELEAVQGMGKPLLDQLLGAELEVGMHAFYPREARFPAIEEFMADIGMELFDVRVARVHRPLNGDYGHYQRNVFGVYDNSPTIAARIWELDAVYFRKRSLLLAEGDPAKLRRMLLAYCTYNYFSEAYNLIEKAPGVLPEQLKQVIVDLHHARHYRPWLKDTPLYRRLRSGLSAVAPRSAPRWCQHMYQDYPNG